MMRVINFVAVIFALCGVSAHADTDNYECLNHLTGSSSLDVNCYIGSAESLAEENKTLYLKIVSEIPRGNKNRNLLKHYMLDQENLIRYCQISKVAGAGWVQSVTSKNIDNMFDVIYYQCIFNFRKNQNSYLRDILDSAKMNRED
jgi:hypothetical protein